jgi:hypothetical protein
MAKKLWQELATLTSSCTGKTNCTTARQIFHNFSISEESLFIQAHAEEIDHLKKTSQQLKSQLEGILHKK